MCDNSIMPENINNLPSLAREVFPDEEVLEWPSDDITFLNLSKGASL
jgi:hypothetical protein